MKQATCLVIPREEAERFLRTLHRLLLVDKGLEFQRTNRAVLIPLVREPSTENLSAIRQQFPDAGIQQALFKEHTRRPTNLQEAVESRIPKPLLSSLPRSFDAIGDIAIVELPGQLDQFSLIIGRGVMEVNPHLRLVLKKSSQISGTFRTRNLEVIAGSGSTETTHKEFSCVYRLDVAKVYFNPRLSHERLRIARQVETGEHVVDMFAGVGPYSILIAKTQPDSIVHSVDINPDAFKYLKENILLNSVADRVIPIFGNAAEISAGGLRGVADRVIMNLPSESTDYIDSALRILKEPGGIVNFYTFVPRTDVGNIEGSVKSIIERQGRRVHSFLFSNVIKEVAPNLVQVAIDVIIG